MLWEFSVRVETLPDSVLSSGGLGECDFAPPEKLFAVPEEKTWIKHCY
jgi:hypothetical protein